jgi:magnesium-protoporphyrin O-methyltransferase
MDDETRSRLERFYRGPDTGFWDRIGLERPTGYLEENMVAGRREVHDLLVGWMEPATGRSVLDAGCGHGSMALALAARGARVTGVDLSPRLIEQASSRATGDNPVFVTGDLRDLLAAGSDRGSFDDILVLEVLEDYTHAERIEILGCLGQSPAQRLYLALRVSGPLTGLLNATAWGGRPVGTVDPLPLLRWIHLNTTLRLTRREVVHCRNYRAEVLEMTRSEEAPVRRS